MELLLFSSLITVRGISEVLLPPTNLHCESLESVVADTGDDGIILTDPGDADADWQKFSMKKAV